MKILMLAPQPFYTDRGLCNALARRLGTLAELGHTIDVLALPGGRDLDLPGVRIVRMPNPLRLPGAPTGPSWHKVFFDLQMLAAAAWMLTRGNYTALHAVEDGLLVALPLKRLSGLPLIYDMMSIPSETLAFSASRVWRAAAGPVRRLEPLLFRGCDRIFAYSTGLAAYVHARAPGATVTTLGDYFATTTPAASPQSTAGPLIVYAGNLGPHQGIELLLDALPLVFRAAPRARALFVGGTRAQWQTWTARIAALGIGDRVDWRPCARYDEVHQSLRHADVLVSPRWERADCPSKVYDYAAAGRPIVAADAPCHRGALSADTALLAEPTAAAMAAAILKVSAQPALGRTLAASAAARLGRRGRGRLRTLLQRAYAPL